MDKFKILSTAAAALLAATTVFAQGNREQRLTPEVMARLFPAGVVSPDYKEAGTTFRCQAADAKSVLLDFPEWNKSLPMKKDGKGVWSLTVSLDRSVSRAYRFIIDGTPAADPNNAFIAQLRGAFYSITAPDENSLQAMKDVPHGKVSFRFFSDNGVQTPICIYIPAGFDASVKYPVHYLLPQDEGASCETWYRLGHIDAILDNRIADGELEKCIVVMPKCRTKALDKYIKKEFGI